MGVFVVRQHEALGDAFGCGGLPQCADERPAYAFPLPFHSHSDVVDKQFSPLQPGEREEEGGDPSDDLASPFRCEGQKILTAQEVLEVWRAEYCVFFVEELRHREKGLLRELLVCYCQSTDRDALHPLIVCRVARCRETTLVRMDAQLLAAALDERFVGRRAVEAGHRDIQQPEIHAELRAVVNDVVEKHRPVEHHAGSIDKHLVSESKLPVLP